MLLANLLLVENIWRESKRKHVRCASKCKHVWCASTCCCASTSYSHGSAAQINHTTCRITYDISTEITCDITQVGKVSKGGFHTIGFKAYGVQVSRVSLHTATHCHTLQRTAAHYNALQHTATHCHTLPHTATHCHTLQCTATHCTTLYHTVPHCSTQRHTTRWI